MTVCNAAASQLKCAPTVKQYSSPFISLPPCNDTAGGQGCVFSGMLFPRLSILYFYLNIISMRFNNMDYPASSTHFQHIAVQVEGQRFCDLQR